MSRSLSLLSLSNSAFEFATCIRLSLREIEVVSALRMCVLSVLSVLSVCVDSECGAESDDVCRNEGLRVGIETKSVSLSLSLSDNEADRGTGETKPCADECTGEPRCRVCACTPVCVGDCACDCGCDCVVNCDCVCAGV